MSDPLNPKRTKSVSLEVSMMKRIGELKAEIERLKGEIETLQNRCDFLEAQGNE